MKPFKIIERVRWIDCDPAQIIYYGSYIRFFEIAETEMYRSMGLPYSEAFQKLNCFPIRAEYYNSYLHPAKLDDEMEISIWISHWGTTSFTISFSFEKKGTKIILAKGYCRLVCVSIEDKQKVKIPELLRSSLQQFTILD
ncbi:MAG: acyl-CoA thioesterase [Chlorobiota bacterium]|nr:acyl-CoA thioesterase [Chlorobiota bacterium]QQS66458.1 MAG: acyl-CoA thioesterase [Chlorobiota bacterium]